MGHKHSLLINSAVVTAPLCLLIFILLLFHAEALIVSVQYSSHGASNQRMPQRSQQLQQNAKNYIAIIF